MFIASCTPTNVVSLHSTYAPPYTHTNTHTHTHTLCARTHTHTHTHSHTHTHTGTAVILNLGTQGPDGDMYKIVPETTKDHANVMTCMKLPGISVAPIGPQGVLPNASLYNVSDCVFGKKDVVW